MIRIAAVFGFLAVALGAFGAHVLKSALEVHDRVGTWETAVLYHLVHAVVLLAMPWPVPRPYGPSAASPSAS